MPVRLPAREAAQFLAQQRSGQLRSYRSQQISRADRQAGKMPAEAHVEVCQCGLRVTIWCGPTGLGPGEQRFLVDWRKRHNGCER
jgi:hypothetical protein